MAIGTIAGMPPGNSPFARVRDEYGSERTVHASQLPEDAEVGEEFAYSVSIFSNESGLATTLVRDPYQS